MHISSLTSCTASVQFSPGTSVALRRFPKEPIMIIREVHNPATSPSYTAVWLDRKNTPHRGVFAQTELVAVLD